MIAAAAALLAERGVEIKPARAAKLVKKWQRTVAPINSTPWERWVVNVETCPDGMPRDVTRSTIYADPTGDTARRNVSRERGEPA